MGNGTADGLLSALCAATMNSNVFGVDCAEAWMEAEVLRWLAQIMGFPPAATGLLVSGTSTGNLLALVCARDAARERATEGQPLAVYASVERHVSVDKALHVLGFPRVALRLIPVDAAQRMDVAALEAAMAADRRSGWVPAAVVAQAGTVNTGAVDPLREVAAVCRRQQAWLHVDGAFGAAARLCLGPALMAERAADHCPMGDLQAVREPSCVAGSSASAGSADLAELAGLEHADSLAFDLHKWFYLQYGVGCVLVRDAARHRAAFTRAAGYLNATSPTRQGAPFVASERGVELSRENKALRVWLALRHHGLGRLRAAIARNLAQAQALAQQIAHTPELELLAPVALNVVCFRHLPGEYRRARAGIDARSRGVDAQARAGRDRDPRDINQHNADLLWALHAEGQVFPTATTVDGRLALRVAITNHRSTDAHFSRLLERVVSLGGRRG